MRTLHIDIETYSDVDIGKCGLYRYAESDAFEVLLFAYAFDEEEPQVFDLTRYSFPVFLKDALQDPGILKVAHNASFERVCLSRYLGIRLDPHQWHCTMVHASMCGYPLALGQVAKAMGFPEDKQKDMAGKRLINFFCKPCKATKANGGRTRNMPEDDMNKWLAFKAYNRQDVVTEQAIFEKLSAPIPDTERSFYVMDQQINDYGVLIDVDMVRSVMRYGKAHELALRQECADLTRGLNIHSVIQLKDWLTEQEGRPIGQLTKEAVENLLKEDLQPQSRRVLELRQETGQTSVKKYEAFDRAVCSDGRMHGIFQFFGARTGRWAGRLVQPQNFPRNEFDDIELARKLCQEKDFESLDMLYGSLNGVFKTLIRTVIIPPEGKKFAIADYSAIEARVLSWIADEHWRMDVFRKGGDIYCASASQMFGVPVKKHGINGHLRMKGKIAELALGYGGGIAAMKAFNADKLGMTEEDMKNVVIKWRAANPHIRSFWYEVESAVKKAVQLHTQAKIRHGIIIRYDCDTLYIRLPSGRDLAYVEPRFDHGGGFSYMGLNTAKQWGRIKSWGGKLVENIIQAIARDCLAEAMLRIHKDYHIVMHIHDEVVVEVPEETADDDLKEIESRMGAPVKWAPGLYLTADGFISGYYRKD